MFLQEFSCQGVTLVVDSFHPEMAPALQASAELEGNWSLLVCKQLGWRTNLWHASSGREGGVSVVSRADAHNALKQIQVCLSRLMRRRVCEPGLVVLQREGTHVLISVLGGT